MAAQKRILFLDIDLGACDCGLPNISNYEKEQRAAYNIHEMPSCCFGLLYPLCLLDLPDLLNAESKFSDKRRLRRRARRGGIGQRLC